MAQTTFFCDECHMDLDESNVRNHISAKHLNYFPYKCFACKANEIKHETLSAEQMYEHTSTVHAGTVMHVRLFMDRENELNAAVENCRRPSIEQVLPNDLKPQVSISLGDTLTNSRNDAIENEVVSTQIKQESDRLGIEEITHSIRHKSGSVHGDASNESLQENIEEIDSLVSPASSTEPTAVVETLYSIPNQITSSENSSALNAVPLGKSESPESVTTVPVGLRLEAALSSYVPIDVEANEAQHNSVVIATDRAPRSKKNNVPSNSVGSPERSATSQLHKPSIPLKKRSRNELDDVSQLDVNSIESPKQRRESLKKKQPAGSATKNVRLRKPITSEPAVLDVPNDPVQNMKIAKIKINISNGNAKFVTSAGRIFNYRPLCEYVPILLQSKGVLDCEAYICIDRTYKQDSRESARKKFEKFAREIYSISHLWANGRVEVDLLEHLKSESVTDFCDELFSQDRSILTCNQLEIKLAYIWPFSVVTNAARHCNQLILKEMRRDHRLHYRLLDSLYERKLPQHIEVTLELRFTDSMDEFIQQLKARFQRSTEQNFKITLLFPRKSASPNMRLQNENGLTLTSTIQASHNEHRDCVMIEQRTSS